MGANPIVWKKFQYRWAYRAVPWRLSLFEHENGSVAVRRLRPPGWCLMQDAIRGLRVPFWDEPQRR